jgi:hypothetical protein
MSVIEFSYAPMSSTNFPHGVTWGKAPEYGQISLLPTVLVIPENYNGSCTTQIDYPGEHDDT